MTRSWQTWLLYGLCVAIVIPAMLWLTVTTVNLDRARELDRQDTELARRYAEMQERISSAMWRMDWRLIPIVAQEAARPSFMYQPFYDSRVENAAEEQTARFATIPLRPSPILVQPSEFIKLHFQVDAANQIQSPQDPQGENRELAQFGCQISPALLNQNSQLVNTCEQSFRYEQLASYCSTDKLPKVDAATIPLWQQEVLASQLATNAESEQSTKLVDTLPQSDWTLQTQQEADEDASASQKQQTRGSNRANLEYLQRSKAAQSYAYGQHLQNQVNPSPLASLTQTGVMRAVWIGDKLVLVRRVVVDNQPLIQGCWLDWEKIHEALSTEIADLFAEFELRPVAQDAPPSKSLQRLATLPVELVIDAQQLLANVALEPTTALQSRTISGLRLSLIVAWIGLTIGLLAIGMLLGGVLRLSERRNDFVSAVTHELRTPLTTFRMYAEMLAEGMVPSQEQQREYARTMKTEADRLGHLVENVLQFARLENKSPARSTTFVSVEQLIDRCRLRLEDRAQQAAVALRTSYVGGAENARLQTVPDSVEQILFNLVENACKYARPSREAAIDLEVARAESWVEFRVRDFGPGISPACRKLLFRPFTKSDQDAANSAQGVGLGLALCQRMARDLGGSLSIDPRHTGPGITFLLRLPSGDDA